MLDAETAQRWAAQHDFVKALRRWTWAREVWPVLLRKLARRGTVAAVPIVDAAALARSFWPWAATFEDNAELEPLEPVDFAHYACGMFLVHLLRQRPLRLTQALLSPAVERDEETRVLTGATLTLLAAWRPALGASPLEVNLQARTQLTLQAQWASYLENVTEDPNSAVAFLDLFTGREPVWREPVALVERPPFRAALQRRREGVC